MATPNTKIKKNPVLIIQRNLLMAIAHEIIKMNDVDIAHVFNTTKQNVNKVLGKSKRLAAVKGDLSPEVKRVLEN